MNKPLSIVAVVQVLLLVLSPAALQMLPTNWKA